MTALASQRHARRSRAGARARPPGPPAGVTGRVAAEVVVAPLFDDLGGEPTLDELVSGVWEGLVAHQRVPCPWCGGDITPVYSAHARPTGGRCVDCETTLD